MAVLPSVHLELDPEMEVEERVQSRSPRYLLRLRLQGSARGSPAASVLVHNLSETGVLIETSAQLAAHELLTLHFPGTRPVDARVEWTSGDLHGCSFPNALSAAEIATILSHSPQDVLRPGHRGQVQPVADAAQGGFPERLKALRERRGLSLDQLAQRAEVSRQAVWYWENGRSAPSTASLQRLVQALGVPLAELTPSDPPFSGERDTVIADFKKWLARTCGVSAEAVEIKIQL